MKKRRTKKKYRLKESAKRFLIYAGFGIILFIYTVNHTITLVKEYKYTKTHEYKLLQLGYNKNDTEMLLNNIEEKYLDPIIEEEKTNNFYTSLVSQKYYIRDNYEKYLNYYKKHPTSPPSEIISIINTKGNEEWYKNTKEIKITDYKFLLNKFNYISKNYKPDNLVKINLQTAYANQYAQEEVVNAYYEMHAKVKEELGINLMVLYSYRSYEDQEKLYNEYTKVSIDYADTLCSRPGHSEHQTGLVLDLISTKNQTLTKFLESEEYKWLINNAHNYGFIIRYPKDKYKITGYKSETNHFRYVGKEFATTLYNEQITLDEYIAYYK